MQMKELIAHHLCNEIRNHEDAMRAVVEFVKAVPTEVIESDFAPDSAERRAFVAGNTVYKFGLYPDPNIAFIEIFDNGESQPTMSLYADIAEKSVRFKGKAQQKYFNMEFVTETGGTVKQSMNFEE